MSGFGDGTVRGWDIATGAERRVLKGHSDSVTAVAFSPNSQLIVSGSRDKTVRVWDITGAERRVLEGHLSPVSAVAFSPDGRLIVSGARDSTVRVWDAATGAERRVLEAFLRWDDPVAFSPDGQLIVSGSSDGTARVWDAATGVERCALKGYWGSVKAVAFSPDSRLIVSGSGDETVRVWDAATGAQQHIFILDTVLRYLRFSSCGQHLVTDRGVLRLPSSNCQSSPHIFATKSWVTEDGEQLLYLHPDYQHLFAFLSGNIVVYTDAQGWSQALQLDLSKKSMLEGV